VADRGDQQGEADGHGNDAEDGEGGHHRAPLLNMSASASVGR
jgi:hypothetical protein